jgi:acetoin utilization deacetylase AcuC-like enzyme
MAAFYSHRSSLQHDTGAHPERAARLEAVFEALSRRDWLGWSTVESPSAAREVLELVHPAAHIEAIERASAAGGAMLDPDTIVSSGSFEAALHAAGGAVQMVSDLVSAGAPAVGFSAHRPPGHHAPAARAMGFCLFNNIAVAARYAVASLGLERVLILDWDVHHGNGTQDIFWEDDAVLFVSIHQSPLYPGSGAASELGGGRGRGFTVNLPVAAGAGDEAFVSLVRDVAVPLGQEFAPQLVLVSAGFDAHADDPLASCQVTEQGFAAMAALVRDLGRSVSAPVGLVLEGGYDVRALARSVVAVMEVLGSDAEPPPIAADPAEVGLAHPLAVAARSRLGEFWPSLSASGG